jgi:GNAT superfamily N-acetyltransferase
METLESTTVDESRDGLSKATHLERSIAGTNGKRPAEVESALTNYKKPKLSGGSDIHDEPRARQESISEHLPDISSDSEDYFNDDEDEVVDEEGDEHPSMDFEDDFEDDSEDDSEDSFDDYGGYLEEEEMEPPKHEFEEHPHVIGKSTVSVSLFCQEEDDQFSNWMTSIHILCTFDGKQIGYGMGRHIKRGRIRHDFWQTMEAPSTETSTVAFELFDRYGCVRNEFKDHCVLKGNGVWGKELDQGDFFVIEYLFLDQEWRRKGLGTLMANLLLKKAKSEGRALAFTLVIPGWLRQDVEKLFTGKPKREARAIRGSAIDAATAFYRSLGFRRVGASPCFALASDPAHGSHSIASNNDYDPQKPDFESMDDGDDPDDDRGFILWGRGPSTKPLTSRGQAPSLSSCSHSFLDSDYAIFLESFKF